MAGIGFVLKKLTKQDNITGLIMAYGHSALVSSGPWIFTVFALGLIISTTSQFISRDEMLYFKVIVIYNFSFSLVFSGPIFIIATRYIADKIYERDVSSVPGVLLGVMSFLFLVQLPVAIFIYFFYANLEIGVAVLAIINFLLISAIWLVSTFVTALKDYNSITIAYVLGLLIAILASCTLSITLSVPGMLIGFNIGLSFILGIIISRIFAEYPYPMKTPFAFLSYFKKYWDIALGCFVYNCAIWIDKWIMWKAPEAQLSPMGVWINPNYDSAMFFAYLTIIPSMAMFIFSIETDFYEKYLVFFRDIQNKVTYKKILQNHKKLIQSVTNCIGTLIILQGTIALVCILASPKIVEFFKVPNLQIGIYRFGVLGVVFQMFVMFLLILLSYFDSRKTTLVIQLIFLITNGCFTWIAMDMGFKYYGMGYLFSSIVTFLVAMFIAFRYMIKLPFHSFITTNTSI